MSPETIISKLENISQLNDSGVVVIFGKTRAGKSAFINDVYGREIVLSTNSLTSDTTTISYVNEDLQIGNHAIRLVDTIGLGGSGEGDDTIHLARTWINIFKNNKKEADLHPTVKGFMYFIDISDAAGLNQDNQDNLTFFKSLIGTKVLDSVFFVTTKWAPKEYRSGRRTHNDFFQQWKTRLNKEFPGAHVIPLDDKIPRPNDKDLREDNPDISELEIQEAKAPYRANLIAILGDILSHPATSPTQTEAEINGSDGVEKSLADTSLGGFAKGKFDKIVKAMTETGASGAKSLQHAANVFSTIKVKDAGKIEFTIETIYQRGVTVTFPFGKTIHDLKEHVKKQYKLDNEDQYYSHHPTDPMPGATDKPRWLDFNLTILPDHFSIRDKSTLLLRTDAYLGRKQISDEAERLAKVCGEDTLGKGIIGTTAGGVVNLVGKLWVGGAQLFNPDVKRQQIRMWKRAAKQITGDTARGGVILGATSTAFSLGQNIVDGGLGRNLEDEGVERIYTSIGLE